MECNNLVPTIKHIAKKLGVKPTQMAVSQKDTRTKSIYIIDIKTDYLTGYQIKVLYNLLIGKIARNVLILQEKELCMNVRIFI